MKNAVVSFLASLVIFMAVCGQAFAGMFFGNYGSCINKTMSAKDSENPCSKVVSYSQLWGSSQATIEAFSICAAQYRQTCCDKYYPGKTYTPNDQSCH